MTNKELIKEISKMEQVIDNLLEITESIDPNKYQVLRYYFSQSDYERMLQILTGGQE